MALQRGSQLRWRVQVFVASYGSDLLPGEDSSSVSQFTLAKGNSWRRMLCGPPAATILRGS